MTFQIVKLGHGARVTITCGCGLSFTIRRPQEGNRSAFHCKGCDIKRMYIWPKRDA